MQESVVREIALQVVEQGLLRNWLFYGILLALVLVGGATSAFVSNYFRKRAETLATKADLMELLRQLERTTEVTEQVRTAVSHADWVSREWKLIRRTKLEELVQSALSVEHWLDQQKAQWLFQKEGASSPPPGDRVAMLTSLYFPELRTPASALVLSQQTALSWIVNTGHKALIASDLKAKETVLVDSLPEWRPLYQAVMQAVSDIKTSASVVMRDITGA